MTLIRCDEQVPALAGHFHREGLAQNRSAVQRKACGAVWDAGEKLSAAPRRHMVKRVCDVEQRSWFLGQAAATDLLCRRERNRGLRDFNALEEWKLFPPAAAGTSR